MLILLLTNIFFRDGKIAIEKLLEKGCQSVLLTLGPSGVVYAEKDKPIIHVPAPKVTAVDTTVTFYKSI